MKMKLPASAAILAAVISVSPGLAQTIIPKETCIMWLASRLSSIRTKDGHWRGWDGPHPVDVIVHGSWWNKWEKERLEAPALNAIQDYLLRMNCD